MRPFITRIFFLLGLLGTSHADAADLAANSGTAGSTVNINATAVDASGNVYLGGAFDSVGLTTPALMKIGIKGAFAIKLDLNGNTVCQTRPNQTMFFSVAG